MARKVVKANAHKPSRRTRLLIAVLPFIGLATIWTGCSVEKHYELLSFFFDGVPDPSEAEQGGGLFAQELNVTYYRHQPFEEGACQQCHADITSLKSLRNDSSVCFKCHAGIRDEYAYMHAPVLTSNCLWCHDPHQATVPKLLRSPAPDLCQRCHNDRLLRSAHVDEPVEASSDCLECHSGHGGAARHFLKPARSGAASTRLVVEAGD